MPFTEDNCLAELTFYESSDRVNNNYLLQQNLPKDGDDIIYTFQSEMTIRIHCEEIELIIK